jgi:hypothetical protein
MLLVRRKLPSSVVELREGIFKLLKNPGIDSKDSIPPAFM